MVSTPSKIKNMSITWEMREYFENVIKPLVTNEKLEELLKSFQDDIWKGLNTNLRTKILK